MLEKHGSSSLFHQSVLVDLSVSMIMHCDGVIEPFTLTEHSLLRVLMITPKSRANVCTQCKISLSF